MKHSNKNLLIAFTATTLGISALSTTDAQAELVMVTVNGTVEYNQITSPPLSGAQVNNPVRLTFTVDSNNFLNNPTFPTRGYPIDLNSYKLSFPTFDIGLQNPYPAGQVPYFVLRNNDPAVDGFFVAPGTGIFGGVPLNQVGGFGNFKTDFHVTYGGSTLSSLDILGALGTYDYTGLTVFQFTVDDGPFNPLGMVFTNMSISAVPEPTSLALAALVLPLVARRRR